MRSPRPQVRSAWLVLLAVLLFAAQALGQPQPIAPGVTYERQARAEGPWVIDIIRIERGTPHVSLEATLGDGQVCGNAPLPEQLPEATAESRPVAAVNGDFFVMTGPDAGMPIGLHMVEGRLIRATDERVAAFWDDEGRMAIRDCGFRATVRSAAGTEHPLAGINQSIPANGLVAYTDEYGPTSRATEGLSVRLAVGGPLLGREGALTGRVDMKAEGALELPEGAVVLSGDGPGQEFIKGIGIGDEVALEWTVGGAPDWATGCLSGGPVLIRDGEIVRRDEVRHPRTAIGFNDEQVLLVTVDGRQPGWSLGMTLGELADLLLELGCTEALNLDGGGSTTMWVRGEIKNRPSDGRPRSVANSLAVVLHGAVGPAAHLRVEPSPVWGLAGARVALDIEAADADYNPLAAADVVEADAIGPVEWDADGSAMVLREAGTGSVRLSAGAVGTIVPVHVFEAPSAVRPEPELAVAMPGDVLAFRPRFLGPDGQVLAAPNDMAIAYEADEGLGGMDEEGRLTVAAEGVSGGFRVQALGVSGEGSVQVATPVVLADGESLRGLQFLGYPADGPTGRLRTKEGSLAMEFDLKGEESSRAAYVRLNRELGRAIGFTCMIRAEGCSPWVRLSYIDGNGTTQRVDLASRLADAGDWQAARVRLPDGTKAPVTLESIYVVETEADRKPKGTLFIRGVTAWVLVEAAVGE